MSDNKNQNKSIFGERRTDGSNPSNHESQPLLKTLKAFFKIAIPYWKTKESIPGWLQVIGIACFTVMTISLAKMFNDWYKEFWDFIQEYNLNGFIGGIILFTFLATCHVVTVVYKSYIISALTIRWRKWLTSHYISKYLDDQDYYKMQLTQQKTDNPDQRIAEDLSSFVSLTISIVINLVTSSAMLVTFAIVLWGLSPAVEMPIGDITLSLPNGYLFYLALVYSFIGTVITFIIGKPLALLNFRQQRYEADFRFSLIRLRENAESVALYKGEKEENKRLLTLFKDVVVNYIHLINRTKALNFFVFACAQTAVIFPILIASPLYFTKVITIGSLMQINSAFGRVYDSLSTIMDIFPNLASWKAVVDRLSLFEVSINNCKELSKPNITKTGNQLVLQSLNVSKPDETKLISNLNLSLNPGEQLLVKGESGKGKSTLLRAIAGIWPYCKGDVVLPNSNKVLFLSQKPYMPLGTLLDTICYPLNDIDKNVIVKVPEMLEQVGLGHLVSSLDVVNQWSHVLSLGEQQRIAFLRVLVTKPDLLFLDEASSALDEDNEAKLYGMVKTALPNVIMVSVGHRSTLTKFHTHVLDLNVDNLECKSI